jgi:hypothetical protein
MVENVRKQRRAKLEELVRRRFPLNGKAERVATALAAFRHKQLINLSPKDWKWVAEDADIGNQPLARRPAPPTILLLVQRLSQPAQRARHWCAEHVRQLGGENPLPSLMEVKG